MFRTDEASVEAGGCNTKGILLFKRILLTFLHVFYIYPQSLSTEISPTPDVLQEQGRNLKVKMEANRLPLYLLNHLLIRADCFTLIMLVSISRTLLKPH